MYIVRGFGSSGPNIRNSCPELEKAGVSDVPGFASCQACPECRGVVMPIGENFFWKFLKVIGQFDLMADANLLEVFLEMAENQPENQEVVVPAAGVVQMLHELSPIYRWVSRDVLGAPPILSQAYLDELKLSEVIFGGGDLEGRYRVEVARPGDRRLLNRASVAPSQLHPNAWSAIRCFELVTDSLRLPQDPEIFLYLFTLFSPNTEGKTKKGYMSVRLGNIGRSSACTKILFMTSKDVSSRFSPSASRDAGMDYVLVTYKGLNVDQKDTADILVKLFFERNLKPKTVLSNPSEAREAIVDMAGKEVTLERLHRLIRPGSSQNVPAVSAPAPGPSKTPVEPQPISAGGGGSSNVGGADGPVHEVSSPVFDETLPSPPSSPPVHLGKRPADDTAADPKRARVSEGTNREFCSTDRSFDASGFIASNLLGSRAQEVLKDYDPMESIRWAEWASLRAATIMKSIEPRLLAADQWEGQCVKLNGDLKALNLQRIEAEKEKLAAEQAIARVEGDLKSLSGKLEALEREKAQEAERRKDREAELETEIRGLRKSVSEENARADKAEASLAESERSHEEVVRMAKDSMAATEWALKDQISLLLPEFDVSQLGAYKVIVDGEIVDLPE
ncbi:hypothetical protein PIB30_065449 [Stylosanthes scabra]|uniref:Uncharacterized protein n=1 Tax=Stylosanthes scabra TaxID=79078 RepID=A0ABU6WLM8_9FABA|nr:hypothetical protein [Stylosanthes scabra]